MPEFGLSRAGTKFPWVEISVRPLPGEDDKANRILSEQITLVNLHLKRGKKETAHEVGQLAMAKERLLKFMPGEEVDRLINAVVSKNPDYSVRLYMRGTTYQEGYVLKKNS